MSTLNEFSKEMAAAVEAGGKYAVMVNARKRFPATGIAIGKDLVLTANHVVQQEEGIEIALPDGTKTTAEVKGRDFASDLALLQLADEAAEPAHIGSEAVVGELVFALGRPSVDDVQASLGIISAVSGHKPVRFGSLEKHYRVDAISYPGFSGGPLVNTEGKVIGINTSHLNHGNLLSIPMDTALKIAESLEQHGSIRRGYLGINSLRVDIVDVEGVEQKSGLLVEGVEEDSPAAKAGLKVGDIILSFDGKKVEEHFELLAAMTGEIVGTDAQMEILRGDQKLTLDAEVEERKESREFRRGPGRSRIARERGKSRAHRGHPWRHHGPRPKRGPFSRLERRSHRRNRKENDKS